MTTCEPHCMDYPLCRCETRRGFPLDEGDTGAALWWPPTHAARLKEEAVKFFDASGGAQAPDPVLYLDLDGYGEPTIWVNVDGAAQPVIRKSDLRVGSRGLWDVVVARLT